MESVRLGIIGLGVMGSSHLSRSHEIRNATITGVCDIVKEKADRMAGQYKCKAYDDSAMMIRSGDVDAVLIATPHYSHTTIGIEALKQGLHVLVEKPISVHKADCQRLIAAHTSRSQIFAAMFNQRTDPHYYKVKRLVENGELGEITRVNWIITNWFRPEAYYKSSGWRATWEGEGGGVLLNQCPHNLDLLQWICGMPSQVTATCSFGKWHDIEVEDEVTAFFEYPNGATGVFITTTGEAPGTNRLEICGDRGKIVIENNSVKFNRTEISVREFSRTSKSLFGAPDNWNIEIPCWDNGGQHTAITQNFIDAIVSGATLIAPAPEGIRSVELANAILYSSMTGKKVDLPIDAIAYEELLKKKISESRFEKRVETNVAVNLEKSFST